MSPEQKRVVMEAMDQPENLTEWEYDFINSLADLPEGHGLSVKQAEVLYRIEQKLD